MVTPVSASLLEAEVTFPESVPVWADNTDTSRKDKRVKKVDFTAFILPQKYYRNVTAMLCQC